MSEQKHTPGPWTFITITPGSRGVGCFLLNVPDIDRKPGQPDYRALGEIRCLNPRRISDEDRANARLIAAAPDLLEALRAVLRQFDCVCEQTPEDNRVYDQALAAIAKATRKGE